MRAAAEGSAASAGPAASASARAIAWAEATLVVPDGLLQGRKFRLLPFQRDFLAGVLDGDALECALTIPRRNGKSSTCAILLLAHLCGPLNRSNWRALVASETGGKAEELRRIIMQIAEASGLAQYLEMKATPAPGVLHGLQGSSADFLSSTKHAGQAVGPAIALVDESGGLEERHRDLWASMLTSISSQRNARFIAIGTQRDGPLFAELLQAEDVFKVVYEARETDDIQDPRVWRRCNPGLESEPGAGDGFKTFEYMQVRARRALGSPAWTNYFRAHDLNVAGIDAKATAVVAADVWAASCVVAPEALPPRSGPCFVGGDIGEANSMTCWSSVWPETGRLEVSGGFPADPPLDERGKADAVGDLYQRMFDEGSLRVYPGKVTPVGPFFADCLEALGDDAARIAMIGFDAYRIKAVETALDQAGLGRLLAKATRRFIGAHSRSDSTRDIGAFQRWVLEGRLQVAPSFMLESAIRSSKIVHDGQGNAHLNKRRAKMRIDALQSTLIAVGLADQYYGRFAGARPRPKVRILKPR